MIRKNLLNKQQPSRKKTARGLLFTALVLVSGCSSGKSGDTIRVVLDWTPNTNHTGLYAALDKGWFTGEGLTVEIMQPPEDGALLLLGSGRAEFAFDFQETMGPAIAQKSGGLPVQAVAAIISHNTSGIMSLKKTGIKRPRDLAGKRFASWETPLVSAIIKDIVEYDGGDSGAVVMIPNFAVDAFSALQTDVDAIWIYYAWDGVAAELRGVDIDYLDLGTINPRFDFYTPVLAANSIWASENGERVKKFLGALSRGYVFAGENPAEAAAILLRYAPELDRGLVERSQEYLSTRYQDGAKRWGEIDPERWGAFYGWMFERGLLETDIRETGFTNRYLPGQ